MGYSTDRNRAYIVFDPLDLPDSSHARAIMAVQPQAQPIPIYHIGHPVIFAFFESATITSIFGVLISDYRRDLQLILLRQKRNKLPYLLGLLSAVITRGHSIWARNLIDRLRALNINLPSHMYELAIDARAVGNYEKVVALCRELLQINPEHIESYHRIAEALRKIGTPSQGITYLQRAVILFPQECHLWGHLGITLQEDGQYREAIKAFDKALAINPGLADLVARRDHCQSALSLSCA